MFLLNSNNLPPRLTQKIKAVQEENDAYAADELVDLGEEILLQLAAMGMAVYLTQAKQKSVYNDFLVSLFLSNGHAYNAGPLYRWVGNMIKEAHGEQAQLLKPFFWKTKNGVEMLNETIHHLASLRNAVMHGFFVLPPDRNREEAEKMGTILAAIIEAKLFETDFGSFHFLKREGFSGFWNIMESNDWDYFDDQFLFGKLAKRVYHEYSPNFREEERQIVVAQTEIDLGLQEAVQELLNNNKGALFAWYRPSDEQGIAAYRQMVQGLDIQIFHPVYFAFHPNGANFTAAFFEQELAKVLVELTSDEKAAKDPWKYLKSNKGKLTKKLVVVIHDLHVALFSPNHLTQLFNTLYDAEVPVLATAWQYPYLKRFSNYSYSLLNPGGTTQPADIEFSLLNYLRFKGPSAEQTTEINDFENLKKIVLLIHLELLSNSKVVARRFADTHQFPIEYVHEAINILSPFYRIDKEPFILDEADELYGFPKTIEESTRIFLTLNRRDIKLEYQHKVIYSN
jgi:hypothetical protein